MGGNTAAVEKERAASLLDAQEKAVALFEEIKKDLLRPGMSEKELSDQIHELGAKRHGVRTHWHKRVIRSGPNTLQPFQENPPDRTIGEDDICYIDLGPVFEAWEADFGRTFVLGGDEHKEKLRDALEPAFHKIKGYYEQHPDITGDELYAYAGDVAKEGGWEWGSHIAGHVVGDFPHERIPDDKITLYITKGNQGKLNSLDKNGHKRHWILEVHLRDAARGNQAFFEQLLTVD